MARLLTHAEAPPQGKRCADGINLGGSIRLMAPDDVLRLPSPFRGRSGRALHNYASGACAYPRDREGKRFSVATQPDGSALITRTA